MRELPILLNGEMVRATMDGRKVTTRRPVRPQPILNPAGVGVVGPRKWEPHSIYEQTIEDWKQRALFHNPHGAPGDLLYVRETCRAEELESGLDGVRYLADNAFIGIENSIEASDRWLEMWSYRHGEGLTVPSIHMPKWAARTWLRVTGVRVERVQDISEDDAVAEGFEGYTTYHTIPGEMFVQEPYDIITPAGEFRDTWDSIYAKRGLDGTRTPGYLRLAMR